MNNSKLTVRACAVSTCQSPKGVHYFSFPRKDLGLQRLWTSKCKRADKINPINAKICERHFTPDDFQRNLQAELLGLHCRKKLKPESFPSIELPYAPSTSSTSKSAREVRIENRDRSALVEQLLRESEIKTEPPVEEPMNDEEPMHNQELEEPEPPTKAKYTQAGVFRAERGVQTMKVYISTSVEGKIKALQRQLASAKRELIHYKARCKFLCSKKYKQSIIKSTFAKKHSRAQLKRMLNPPKGSQSWKDAPFLGSDDEIIPSSRKELLASEPSKLEDPLRLDSTPNFHENYLDVVTVGFRDDEVSSSKIIHDHPYFTAEPEPEEGCLRNLGTKASSFKEVLSPSLASVVKKLFNVDQIRYMVHRSKVRKWSLSTMRRAMNLHLSCGDDGYENILNQGFPFPSLKTLRRYMGASDLKGALSMVT